MPYTLTLDTTNKHEIKILTSIMLQDKARYSDLNSEKLPTNQFNYHLKLLLTEGYIKKQDDRYMLTEKGEELAGDIDIFANDIEKQGKISAVAICKKVQHGTTYYLMQKRKKQPYYGYCGFPAGKIKYGNNFTAEVLRELEEETGLTGKATLRQISHILVTDPHSGEIQNDFTFFKFLITRIKGKLIEDNLEGFNSWMSLAEIQKEKLIFPGVCYAIELLNKRSLLFKETTEIYKQSAE